MAKYRKTALVEAEQFLPGRDKIPPGVYSSGMADPRRSNEVWMLRTLEGEHVLRDGDYICTGPAGEKWNVAREIFEKTYEEVSNAEPSSAQQTITQLTGDRDEWRAEALRRRTELADAEEATLRALSASEAAEARAARAEALLETARKLLEPFARMAGKVISVRAAIDTDYFRAAASFLVSLSPQDEQE